MKVLHVIPGTSQNYGGPSVALTDMTRLLCSLGIDSTILTTNIDPLDGRLNVTTNTLTKQRGAPIIYCNVWPATPYAFSPSLFIRLLRSVNQYDLLHIHWLYNFSPIAAAAVAKLRNIPYVVQPNGSLDPNLMRRKYALKRIYNTTIGRFILNNAKRLIYTTQAEARLAVSSSCKTPHNIVPVGLDSQLYNNLPPHGRFRNDFPALSDNPFILFLSRISRQKGLDILIPAFHAISKTRTNLRLVIAGSDGENFLCQVKRWVTDFGLSERVIFTGRLSEEQKLAAYVDAEVFVLPSYAENFGAVVTEALAAGCPVVISDRVNLSDDISAAHAGIVTQCTADSVAAGLDTLLRDRQLRSRMSNNGQKLVKDRFTWDNALRQIIPIYKAVIDAHDYVKR